MMRKIIVTLIALLIGGSIGASIGFSVYSLVDSIRGDHKQDNRNISISSDKETGCQYLVTPQGHITPRIGADFMHSGCRGFEDE